MALPIGEGPPRKLRGRPKNSGTLKDPDRKATISTKLSREVHGIVEGQRAHNESISDTILRLIQYHHHKRSEAEWKLQEKKEALEESRKKVDALQRRLNEIESLTQFEKPLLNDYCEAI